MRARSAHLRTSWWVVVVWAALGILTGVISVVTVLQPTWYVRYTLIHAQALQDVTFQVVVSSVGPLGFCRLTAVETHQVIDNSKVPLVFKKGFSTPSNNFKKTIAVTDPAESFSFPDSTLTSESLPGPLEEVTKKPEHEMWKSTEAPPESFHTSRAADEAFQEWPTPGVHYSNSSFGVSLATLSPPDPTGKDTDEKSNSDGVRVSKDFQISTITDKGITAGKSDGIGDVLFRVTEKYLNVIYEKREKSSDNGHPDDKNRTVTLQEKKEIGMSDVENSITEKGFISHGDQDVGDSRRQDVDNGGKFIRENATGVNEFNTHNNKKNPHTSYRRRKKKKKKEKKKKKKKKRNKKKRKNKLHRLKFKRMKGSFYDGSSSKLNDVIGTPAVEANMSSFFNRHQSSKMNMSFNEEEIIAEFLIQQDGQTAYERNTIAIDYQPRMPIMLCSGVTVGVGSGSSAVWVLVGVVYGVAGVVQVMAGVASILTQAVPSPAGRYAHAIWVGNVQVAVVMSQGVTLVLFPLGLGSPLARVECGGSSSVYWPGDCTFGWAYMLAIVATTLAAYCPCLARLTVYKRYSLREWESLNFF